MGARCIGNFFFSSLCGSFFSFSCVIEEMLLQEERKEKRRSGREEWREIRRADSELEDVF